MEYRYLGRTGLRVSQLGFGCGAVGGLLVKGERREQLDTVARAIELGVTYFDTARIYGNGLSETNLGAVLKELGADVLVGTKVRLEAGDMDHIEQATIASVEGSLRRLQRDCVDLIQLHNSVAAERAPGGDRVSVEDVVRVGQVFRQLIAQGKARAWGMNGLGETQALHQALASSGAQSIQCCYNLLNPTAGASAPNGFPFQDFDHLIDRAAERGTGVIAIRVLAGGALSGSTARLPNAAPSVTPIATSADLYRDAEIAQRFACLVEAGHVASLVEAAIRFAQSKPELSTALVGISNLEQLEQAVAYVERGPLSSEALEMVGGVWTSLAEDSRTP